MSEVKDFRHGSARRKNNPPAGIAPTYESEERQTTSKVYAVQTVSKVINRGILLTTDPGDLVFAPTCVRKGTRVWRVSPTPALPVHGEEEHPFPRLQGEEREAEPIPIQEINPSDYVLAHDGKPHRVLRVIRRHYRGEMIGLRHHLTDAILWLTPDHRVLAKTRPRTLGGRSDWSGIPKRLRGRNKELRREMTPPERKLWSRLRDNQIGFTFRRQHPIGPYIADFYSREARLVVEVDGAVAHGTEAAIAHDRARDAYLQSLGLQVLRIPAREVMRNLEGVCEAIRLTCEKQMSPEDAQWVEAGDLAVGDVVFFGPELVGTRIIEIRSELTEEEIYDLQVEGVHSFLTEVCAVHNCGSGTTAYCAEKWGRRWITCDTSRVALAIARQRSAL